MTASFKQPFYRIQQPDSSPVLLAKEIEKILEQDDYLHIIKTTPHTSTMMPPHVAYLFFQRDDAFGAMQSVMRNLGLIEDGWDLEDVVTLDGADTADDIEVDETTPETEQWRIVEEYVILNAQEA